MKSAVQQKNLRTYDTVIEGGIVHNKNGKYYVRCSHNTTRTRITHLYNSERYMGSRQPWIFPWYLHIIVIASPKSRHTLGATEKIYVYSDSMNWWSDTLLIRIYIVRDLDVVHCADGSISSTRDTNGIRCLQGRWRGVRWGGVGWGEVR
jgi:hypothetical protein